MEQKYTFDKVVHFLLVAAIVVAVFFVLKYLSGVLLPFFLAWFLSYLLYPIVKFVQYKLRVRVRALATLITMLAVAGVIVGIGYLVIPPMMAQFDMLGHSISHYVSEHHYEQTLIPQVRDFLSNNADHIRSFFEGGGLVAALQKVFANVFSLLGYTVDVVISIVASCIVILYMFFILHDYEYLSHNWVRMFPVKHRKFWREVMRDVEKALNSYIRGQGLVALCVGVMFCIGLSIINFPMAIALGIIIGILDLVPYLHGVALIPAALLSILKAADTGQSFLLIYGSMILVFIIVQTITDFVVVPKIMGKAMGLNPAVLLLALSVWGSLLGFIGLILALPLTTLLFVYWRRYVTKELEVKREEKEETP